MSAESVTNYLQNVSLVKNSTANYGTYVKLRKYAPAPFNVIPLNVLIKIFQYFDEDELRKCVIPVSQIVPLLQRNLNTIINNNS